MTASCELFERRFRPLVRCIEGESVAADARYGQKKCDSNVAYDHIVRIVRRQGVTIEDFGGFYFKDCLYKEYRR